MTMAWQSVYYQPPQYGIPGYTPMGHQMKQALQHGTHGEQFHNMISRNPLDRSGNISWSTLYISERQKYTGFPVVTPQRVGSVPLSAVRDPGGFPVANPQPVSSVPSSVVGNPGGFPVASHPQPVNSVVGNPGGFPVANHPQRVSSVPSSVVGNPGGFPVASHPQPISSVPLSAVGNPGSFPVASPQPISSVPLSAVGNPGGFPVANPQPVSSVPLSAVVSSAGFSMASSQQACTMPRSGQLQQPNPFETGGLRPGCCGPPMPTSFQHGGGMPGFHAQLGHQGYGQDYQFPLPAAQSNGAFTNVSQLGHDNLYGSGCCFSVSNTFAAKHPTYNQALHQLHHNGTSAQHRIQPMAVGMHSVCDQASAGGAVLSSIQKDRNEAYEHCGLAKSVESSNLPEKQPANVNTGRKSATSRSRDKTDRHAKTVSKKSIEKDYCMKRWLSSRPVENLSSSKSVESLQSRIEHLLAQASTTIDPRNDSSLRLSTTSVQNACKCARNPISCDLHNPLRSPAKENGNEHVLTAGDSQNHASPVVQNSLPANNTLEDIYAWDLLERDVDIMTLMYRSVAKRKLDNQEGKLRTDIIHSQPSGLDQSSPQMEWAANGLLECRHFEQEAVSPSTEMRSGSGTAELENEEADIFDFTCIACSKVFKNRNELCDHLSEHLDVKENRCLAEKDDGFVLNASEVEQEQPVKSTLEPRGSHLLCATSLESVDKLVAYEQEQAACGEGLRKNTVSETCSGCSPLDVNDSTNASTCSQAQRKSLQSPVLGQRYTMTVETDPNSRTADILQNADQLTPHSSKDFSGLGFVSNNVSEGRKDEDDDNCSTDNRDMEQELNSSRQNIQQSKHDSVNFGSGSETQPLNSGGVLKSSADNSKNRKPNSTSDEPNPASDRSCLKPNHTDKNTETRKSSLKTGGQNSKKCDSGKMSTISETSLPSDLQNSIALSVHYGDTTNKKESEQKHRRKHREPLKSAVKEMSSAGGRIPVDAKTVHSQQHGEDRGCVKQTEVSEKSEGQESFEANRTPVSIKRKNGDLPVYTSQKRKCSDIVTNARHEKEHDSDDGNLLVNQDVSGSKSNVFRKFENSPCNSVQEKGVGKLHAAEQKSVTTERAHRKSSHSHRESKPGSQECKTSGRSDGRLDGVPSSAFDGKQTSSTSQTPSQRDKQNGGAEDSLRDESVRLSVRNSCVQVGNSQASSETDQRDKLHRSEEQCASSSKEQSGQEMADMPDINSLKKWKRDKHGCVTGALAERTDNSKHSANSVSSPKKKHCSSQLNLAGDGQSSSKMKSTDLSGRTPWPENWQSDSPNCSKSKTGGQLIVKTVKAQRIVSSLKNIFENNKHLLPNSVEKQNLRKKDVSVTNVASAQKSKSDSCEKVTKNDCSENEVRSKNCPVKKKEEDFRNNLAYLQKENAIESRDMCTKTTEFGESGCQNSRGDGMSWTEEFPVTSSDVKKHRTDCSDQSSEGKQHRTDCGDKSSEGKQHRTDCGDQSSDGKKHRTDCSDQSSDGKKHRTDCGDKSSEGKKDQTDYGDKSFEGKKHRTDCSGQSSEGKREGTKIQGFPTRMVHLKKDKEGRYTILAPNPRNCDDKSLKEKKCKTDCGEKSSEEKKQRTDYGDKSSDGKKRRTDSSDKSSEGKIRRTDSSDKSSEGKIRRTDSGDKSSEGKKRRTDSSDKSSEGKIRRTDSGDKSSDGKKRTDCDDQSSDGKKRRTDCGDQHSEKSLLGDGNSKGRVDPDLQMTFCVKCNTVFMKRSAYDQHGCCQVGHETSDKEEESAEEYMDIAERLGENQALDKDADSHRDRVCEEDRIKNHAHIQLDSDSDRGLSDIDDDEWVPEKDRRASRTVLNKKLSKMVKKKKRKTILSHRRKVAKKENQAKVGSSRDETKSSVSCAQTMFRCDHCEQSFASQGGLLFHWKTVHKKV